MPDLTTMGPDRALPEEVRAAGRERLVQGMSAPTNRSFPVVAAVAVTALVAGVTAWTIVATDRSGSVTTAGQPPVQLTAIPPEVVYGVQDAVPADTLARCAADGWTAQWQASSRGAEIVVLASAGRVRFCETTPAGVTLSSPTDSGTAGATITFRSTAGTVAGVTGGEVGAMRLTVADRGAGETYPYVRDGIFVAPNALPSSTSAVRLNGRLTPLPPVSPAHIDRPQPGGVLDPQTDACLHASSAPPVVDAGSWHAGTSVTSRSTDVVLTARYGNLLATCVINENEITRTVSDGERRYAAPMEVKANDLLYTFSVFVGFEWVDGANRSETVAVTGLVLDDRVARVELSRPQSGPVRGEVTGGTFVLCDVNLNEGRKDERDRTTLTAFDAVGNTLAVLSMPI